MKKLFLCLCLLCFICTSASAFVYEAKILSKDEIASLKDEEIQDVYISVMIEKRASEVFHQRSGFAPKEYKKFKALLAMIIRLRREMRERKIEADPVEEWLK